ncbi:MAG: ABC transporter permease [Deltaproteobacteria bacterium]
MFFGFNKEDFRIVVNLFKMYVRDKYLGSRIGMLWSIINPLLLFGIYIYVFGFVFNSKMPGSDKSLTFVIWLTSGYAPWLAISEGILTATSSVVSGTALVKNIVFKVELLPMASTLMGIFPMAVGFLVLVPLLIIEGTGLSLNILWLILLIPLQMFFLIGVGFFLSALHVFVRDVLQIVSSVLLILVFFTPIFYPLEMMPPIIRNINFYNPLYQIANSFRQVIVGKHPPDFWGVGYLILISLFLWVFGLRFFRKLKGYFQSCL